MLGFEGAARLGPPNIGTRITTSHWLPRRNGPSATAAGSGRVTSADSHSLAMPLAVAVSFGGALNTLSSALIQKVFGFSGTESRFGEAPVLLSACAAELA